MPQKVFMKASKAFSGTTKNCKNKVHFFNTTLWNAWGGKGLEFSSNYLHTDSYHINADMYRYIPDLITICTLRNSIQCGFILFKGRIEHSFSTVTLKRAANGLQFLYVLWESFAECLFWYRHLFTSRHGSLFSYIAQSLQHCYSLDKRVIGYRLFVV